MCFTYRDIWAEFLTDDPAAWTARIGEHDMTVDTGAHEDVEVIKIVTHPQRQGTFKDFLDSFLHIVIK